MISLYAMIKLLAQARVARESHIHLNYLCTEQFNKGSYSRKSASSVGGAIDLLRSTVGLTYETKLIAKLIRRSTRKQQAVPLTLLPCSLARWSLTASGLRVPVSNYNTPSQVTWGHELSYAHLAAYLQCRHPFMNACCKRKGYGDI